jgi:hypothetical protein
LLVSPSLDIDSGAFSILTRARLLSTRGYGEPIMQDEIITAVNAVTIVPQWMRTLRSQQEL